MQIYISKQFSKILSNRSKNELELFNKKVNDLKEKNKTEIVEHDDVIELAKDKGITLYALYMESNKYIVFSFKEKNKLVLFDEIVLLSDDKIQSSVYPDEIN